MIVWGTYYVRSSTDPVYVTYLCYNLKVWDRRHVWNCWPKKHHYHVHVWCVGMFMNCLRNKFHVPNSKFPYISPPDMTLRTFLAVYILKVIVFPKVIFISNNQYKTLFYNLKLYEETLAGIGGRLLIWLICRSWVTLSMPVPGTPARWVLWSGLPRMLDFCSAGNIMIVVECAGNFWCSCLCVGTRWASGACVWRYGICSLLAAL